MAHIAWNSLWITICWQYDTAARVRKEKNNQLDNIMLNLSSLIRLNFWVHRWSKNIKPYPFKLLGLHPWSKNIKPYQICVQHLQYYLLSNYYQFLLIGYYTHFKPKQREVLDDIILKFVSTNQLKFLGQQLIQDNHITIFVTSHPIGCLVHEKNSANEVKRTVYIFLTV